MMMNKRFKPSLVFLIFWALRRYASPLSYGLAVRSVLRTAATPHPPAS
jgi:hypothetical protein